VFKTILSVGMRALIVRTSVTALHGFIKYTSDKIAKPGLPLDEQKHEFACSARVDSLVQHRSIHR
jgi:hypothetical protein